MAMNFDARLIGTLSVPGVRALLDGSVFESGGHEQRRVLLKHGAELAVHDRAALLAGEGAPETVFPLPWPGWDRGVHSVSPDSTFAVFSGQRSVRAVAADGGTLWSYAHGCWNQEVGHVHTSDEQQVCRGNASGSCRVSDDGRLVWAHVVDSEEYGEHWVVLDARDGRELARWELDGVASGSWHTSHPDGVHMGLCVGMGQDGALVYWGRWDGETLAVHDELNEGLDRVLADVHPDHPGFLTIEHNLNGLQTHALDGTSLAERRELPWDWCCGFLDGDTVLATSGIEFPADPEETGTWLLDARTLEIRGRVTYPPGTVDGVARPLGDGTWLTHEHATETVRRWTL